LMAAFLPQMLMRVSNSSEEIELGTLRAIKLSAAQIACAIFRAGPLYMIVVSKPGQLLPEPVLDRVAGALAQSKH
jgi:hypothetical protein